jgi:prepilin signal peptidase PulO-like enzyme (type II secretory pathway)
MLNRADNTTTMIKKDTLPGVMTIIGYAVAALFVAFGLYVLFSPQMVYVPKEFRNIFGIVVVGYGLFRAVIIYQKSRERKEDDENDM